MANLLDNARTAKKDEFYTSMFDINAELIHYKDYFRGKTVLCNCDDPRISNFTRFFVHHFELWGLKRLISVCYKSQEIDLFSQNDNEQAVYMVYDGDKNGNKEMDNDEIEVIPLKGDGDFRSRECIELLEQADVVVTNPPFSLWREYIKQLMDYNKDFIILGNMNATTYKDVFQYFKENRLWYGVSIHSGDREFQVPDSYPLQAAGFRVDENGNKFIRVKGVRWFTNIPTKQRFEPLDLFQEYTPEKYVKFDNYEAINVDKTCDIPADYFGYMGVPITFLDKYCPTQFEIVGLIAGNIKGLAGIPSKSGKDGAYINGKLKYGRIIIKRKQEQ